MATKIRSKRTTRTKEYHDNKIHVKKNHTRGISRGGNVHGVRDGDLERSKDADNASPKTTRSHDTGKKQEKEQEKEQGQRSEDEKQKD